MRAEDILDDQIIIKKGRFNTYGFEPCANSFFDFYVSPKYISPPLLKLEDISFHLFLRKNLNDHNPRWKMPSINQMMARLDVSYSRLRSMMNRLDRAHLLKKESGFKRGKKGENVRNTYVLSDPIQTLDEFLTVANEGVFLILPNEPYRGKRDTLTAEIAIAPIAEIAMQKQTLNPKQTVTTLEEKLWENCLKQLQQQLPADSFHTFLADTMFKDVTDGVAVITTNRSYAKDYLENRMGSLIKKVLGLELKMNGGQKIDSVRFEIG